MPPFVALKTVALISPPIRPAVELTLTTRPHCCGFIASAAARVRKKTDFKLILIMRSNHSSVMSAIGMRGQIPALFTRISSLPNAATTFVTNCSHSAGLPTSQRNALALPPFACIDCATFSARSSLMSATATVAPFSLSKWAVASPIPCAPPVTMATRFSRDIQPFPSPCSKRSLCPRPKPLPRKEGGASIQAFPLPLFTGGRGRGIGGLTALLGRSRGGGCCHRRAWGSRPASGSVHVILVVNCSPPQQDKQPTRSTRVGVARFLAPPSRRRGFASLSL